MYKNFIENISKTHTNAQEPFAHTHMPRPLGTHKGPEPLSNHKNQEASGTGRSPVERERERERQRERDKDIAVVSGMLVREFVILISVDH